MKIFWTESKLWCSGAIFLCLARRMEAFAPFILLCLEDMDFAKLVMPLQLIQALLVMSGDVEINPGPGKRGRSESTSAVGFTAVEQHLIMFLMCCLWVSPCSTPTLINDHKLFEDLTVYVCVVGAHSNCSTLKQKCSPLISHACLIKLCEHDIYFLWHKHMY